MIFDALTYTILAIGFIVTFAIFRLARSNNKE